MKKLISITLFVALVTTIFAQAPDRSAPPPLLKAKDLQLPPIQRFSLSNGLNVVLLEKHTVPLVQINLLVQSGPFDDPAGKEGLSSLTFDLMDEGAGELNSLQLADEIEYLGASISTFSSNFSSGINVGKVLAVDKKAVEATAKKYIIPENMLIVIVGDRAKVEAGIKKLNLGKIINLSIEDVLGKKPQL